jgi:two-component system, OmpR family, phosphate regulon sensor histidine kinase PhoR
MLHRAQVVLILAALVPTILTTPIGVVLLAEGGSNHLTLVAGILVLAFCAAAVTGYVVGSIFMYRGARLVRVQTDFLASVSHELRTPMTSMRMFVEALLDRRLEDREERERCLRTLHQELVRLDGLVGRLIDLTRFESGGRPFTAVPVALDQVLEETLAAFTASHYPDPSRLKVDAVPGLRVYGDHAALVQVLLNLLTNALKHGEGAIELKVAPAGTREVLLAVKDHGPGIPNGEQQRIFGRFERGSAAIHNGTPGSGLGLAIVQAYVKAHRGRIELDSKPGAGATFRVYLPVERSERP